MYSDHRQHSPLTRRKAIDRLLQLLPKKTAREQKKVRKWIAKLSADQMRAIRTPQLSNAERGRLANIQNQQQRDLRIKKRRAETAAFRASKPVFE